MVTLSKLQMDAAGEFANAAMAAMKVPGGIHPATVIAASARMAGTYLFRSFELDLQGVKPGQIVLSPQAAQREGDLIQVALGSLARFGIKVALTPPQSVNDPQNQPVLAFLDTQRKIEPAYFPICRKFNFSAEQAAHSAAAATALLVRHCATALEPNVAFGVAAFGFIEGCKTTPDSFQDPHDAA
jgi:hypothetical protein